MSNHPQVVSDRHETTGGASARKGVMVLGVLALAVVAVIGLRIAGAVNKKVGSPGTELEFAL